MATTAPLAVAVPTPRRSVAAAAPGRGRLLPALLVGGCAVAAAAVAAVTASAPPASATSPADAELAQLLRAMAAIKAVMLLAGVGVLAWRLRRPTPAPFAAAYLAGAWVASGAVAAMWALHALGVVAVVLHATAAAVAVLAWRDAGFVPAPAPAAAGAARA